jgi:osmoprotectant transport system permease protein
MKFVALRMVVLIAASVSGLLCFSKVLSAAEMVNVGSKAFTEGYVLGEILAQTLEESNDRSVKINRRLGMGGTGILYQGLLSGEIQLYSEYMGTITEVILKQPQLKKFDEIQAALKSLGLIMSKPLGFNNTYAIAVRRDFAEKYSLTKISELAAHLESARLGFSHEFATRADGLPGLRSTYGFANFGSTSDENLHTMEHSLSYEAIAKNELDVIDVNSTDAKIKTLNLTVLEDDKKFFPRYDAVILARADFTERHANLWLSVKSLEQKISADTMRDLNALVDDERRSFADVANFFLGKKANEGTRSMIDKARLFDRTSEHLVLVGVALVFSILVGIPLGIIATQSRVLGQTILLVSGVVQTIPSLALLCFLIPLFGIGFGSALVALCLYGLLPVVMNTFTGLRSIDPALLETSKALGLGRWQSLIRIRIPLASRTIMSGVKTSAIVGIGTATLAALIGAGGYGATILSGLATNDVKTIFMGAAPAAVMALVAHGVFEILDSVLIPKGLR